MLLSSSPVPQPRRHAALFSAANLNGIGALLFCLSLGSVPGAFLFASIVLLGFINKLEALGRDRFARHDLLVLKPEITATVLMMAAALNAVTGVVTYAIYKLHLPTLQPWFPQNFISVDCQLLLAFAWAMGSVGDYALKLSDRRRFSGIGTQRQTALLLVFGNPSFWYSFACMGTSLLGLYLIGVQVTPFQKVVVGLSLVANLAAIAYGSYAALRNAARANDGMVNWLSCLAPLLASLQPLAAGLQGHALPLFGAQLVLAASHLLIGHEVRAASLRPTRVLS